MRFTALALVWGSAWSVVQAAEIPVRDFARLPEYHTVRISPKGEYLAVAAPFGDQTGLTVIRLADNKITAAIRFPKLTHAFNFAWSGPDRVVIELAKNFGSVAQPYLTGEIVGMNADGKQQRYLVGYRGEDSFGARANTKSWDPAFLLRTLPRDPRHVLVTMDPWSDYGSGYTAVSRMDVYSGLRHDVTAAPFRGHADFITDMNEVVRYAVGFNLDHVLETHYRASGDAPWTQLDVGKLKAKQVYPLRMSADGSVAYLESDEGHATTCLVRHRLDTNERKVLACDEEGDLGRVIYASDRRTPIAAVFAPGAPSVRMLETDHPDRAWYASVARSFPGQYVDVASQTEDGRLVVLGAASDRNPGDYYLFDRQTGKATYLLSQRSWIKADQMAERRPFKFQGRNGTVLHGYLTIPVGREPQSLPMVVNPHGGPFGPRDDWFWDADAQFLASRGYLVLQVNFSGSGGYGKDFEDRAKKAWGTMMIDDITDATRWAIAQKYADPKRICIYGGSYGGYASLMSVVREPDLYRCAIGYAGVYDLNAMKSDTDISRSAGGGKFLDDYMGADRAELAAQSPVTYLDRLKAAIFIVHGENDERAPYSQARILRSALDARHYPYEWLTKPGEAHGFYGEANRIELYERMEKFLATHIGPDPKPK